MRDTEELVMRYSFMAGVNRTINRPEDPACK